jgi:hypothetical protein
MISTCRTAQCDQPESLCLGTIHRTPHIDIAILSAYQQVETVGEPPPCMYTSAAICG